jgi:hypothetical protein
VWHFDGKGRVPDCVREAFPGKELTVNVCRVHEGTAIVLLDMDNTPNCLVSVNALFAENRGRDIPLVADLRPLGDHSAIGATVAYALVPNDVFAGFPFPGAADLAGLLK